MNPSSYNAWKLVSLSPLPTWALVLLAAVVSAGVVLAAWGVLKEPNPKKRVLLWSLRVLAGVCALFFLLEPGIRRLQVAQVKNRVAVLVDRSASMGFPAEPQGPTRSFVAGEALEKLQRTFDGLRERFNVEVYAFDPELSPTSAQALKAEPPRGGRTDILSALKTLKAGEQGGESKKLSGVLLVSDGADNAELASGAVGKAKSDLSALGFPVSTLAVGQETLKDLAIEGLKVDDFAFVRNSVTVEIEVKGRGFKGASVPLVLKREGQVVASKSVELKTADELVHVSFTFTPDQTGRFVYTVSVPVFPDEAVAENNTRSFTLKVIRDRVRVLLVVGRPSWDERFLRGLLRQDANVDLVSFYILRTLSDDPLVRDQERELSLIPFPMEEIFDTKLDTFDVVVFQNFGYTDPQLSIEQYERNLERYIHNGGGFVMIGGDHAFGEARANFRTLGLALPVEPAGQPANLELHKPRVTADGLRHPVTALGNGAPQTEQAWSSLPAVPGANITRLKPGATALLEHPTVNVDGKAAPVLALWDYGRGRAMALTIDSSWYWAFTSHASGAPSRHYDRFWGNALRWLVRDPDLTTLKVAADPPTVEPGKPVGVVVTARQSDYQPAADAEVRVSLVSVSEQKVIGTLVGNTGPDGSVRLEFPAPAPGAYKLLGSAKKGEKSLGEADDAVAVRAVGPELSDASVRAQLLGDIARLTGGKVLRSVEGTVDLPLLDPPVVEVGRSKDQPIWDRWYFLMVLVALLGAEWFLRRRFGYI